MARAVCVGPEGRGLNVSEAADARRAPNCVVVTGAAGFLGTALCEQLTFGAQVVIGVDKRWRKTDLQHPDSQQADRACMMRMTLDVRDKAVASVIARTRPDVIFHLAG